MAQDNVSEVLSSGAKSDLAELNSGLEKAVEQLEKFGKIAKGITIDFKGVKDFATLTELQDKVTAATKKMEKAQRDFADEIDRAQVKEVAAVNKLIAAQEKKAQREEAILNRMIAAEEKASAKAIAAQQKRAKEEERILNKMIADEAKAAAQKEKIIAKSAAEAEKAAKREAQAIGKLSNDYELLKIAYNEAAAKAKELGVTFGTNSQVFKDAASNAKVMYDRLLKVELAVGQAQRQVGQYNQAAFAMQQILRETPSIANGFGTWVMAISNNLPILTDEIKRARAANEELAASGAKTIPVWKQLLGAFKDPATWITMVVSAIAILAVKTDIFKSSADKAAEATKKLNDELRQMDEQAQKTAASEQARLEILVATAKNTALAMDVRMGAVKQMQDMYPDYLGNLDKERILTGEITNELDDLNRAIAARSMMTAVGDKMTKEYERIIKAEAEIANIQAKSMVGVGGAKPSTFLYGGKSIQEYKDEIRDAEDMIKQYEKLIDKYAGAAGKLLKPPPTKTSVKGGMSIGMGNEAIQAAYDASIQELSISRDKNKAIADDEKRSLEERLQAYNMYNAAVLSIVQQQKNKELNEEALKFQEIQADKKGKSGQELKNLIDQEQAVIINIKAIRDKANADTNAATEKAKKDQLAIIYSNNEQWIKSEEFRNEKLKELQIGLFLQDVELLNRQLKAKEITQRQYNDKMKQLRKTEGVMLLDDDIALYEKILANDQITAERRLDIQRKLNNALKAKSQMSEGQPMRKSGRLTDALGMSLGITDESALQEFYDRSIALANQAADAIIDAKRRQYEAEMGMLDRQKEAIDANYQLQYDYINATTKDETEKANKIAQLQAQKQSQDAEIDGKKREVAKRMAAAEKTAAIASIIQSTAVAIAGALKYGPAAPPIIALIAAAGAVQLAAAANTPIPAYAKGTDNHIGGAFFAGDGGEPEYIKAPNKAGYWSASSTTLYNEPKGTTVTPMSKFVDVVGSYKVGGIQKESERKLFEYLGDKFAEHLWQHGENLSHVIMAAQPKQQKQDLTEAVIKLQRLGR